MLKKLLSLCFFLSLTALVQAQAPPPCGSPTDPAADDCVDACIYCSFSSYSGSTSGYTQGSANGFCGTIENEQWLGFIAGGPSATFTGLASNCTIGNGIQLALYAECDGNPIDCNQGGQNNAGNPVTVSAALTPGANYYLLIDGFAGDECDFTITVSPPSAAQAPPVGPVGSIQGPTNLCPGATVVYTVPPVTGAGVYTWTAPAGSLINGEPSPAFFIAPGGNSVTVTIGSQGGQICVNPNNSCDMDNPTSCKTVTIAPIPPTNLPKATICNEDVPYTTPWGEDVFQSGTYSETLESWLGCDSVVTQQVVIKAPILNNIGTKTVCAGTCFTVCGEQFCDGGSFSATCDSWQGCDSTVNFALSVLNPIADIIGGGTLSCTTSSIQLTSAASDAGTLKIWKNGTGTIVGTGNSITVTQPGTYILTAQMSQGGTQCVKADTIVINGNTTAPTVGATVNGVIGCTTSSVVITGSTNAATPAWIWAGPGGFTSSSNAPSVTAVGTYTVTVTNTANGCTATTTASVTGNTTPPTANTTTGTITCSAPSVQITASTNAGSPGFSWSGPNGFTSTVFNPTVTVSGPYVVTVTNPVNGCTASATALVAIDVTPPGATTSVTGAISCPTPSITVNGNPSGAGLQYSWTGPGGFTSAVQNPSVNTAGTYTLTVTGNNGCTSTATASVTGDVNPPNVSASGGTLSCTNSTITINGNSTNNPATFAWVGPGTYASSQQNPNDVNIPGPYTLTVTGQNGCTASATVLVSGDFAPPQVSAAGGIITCQSTSTTINGSSSTPGATIAWAGPGGFTSTQNNPVVSNIGNYILTATGPNGCTATATAIVSPDANVPSVSATGGTLNCTVVNLTLDGSSSAPNLLWTGPNGFTSTAEDPVITDPGVYTLTATNTSNGCSAQANATVILDNTAPGATATGGTLTCALPNFQINGNSGTNGVTYSWTGPNNFTSSQQNPQVNDAGTYILTVTSPQNGCTSSASAQVLADQNAPTAASTTDTLTCSVQSVVLNGSANTTVSYSWSGPNSFSSTQQNPTVTVSGSYTLTVTAANGCTDAETVIVGLDIAAPDVAATGNTLSCTNPSVQITGTSTAGISFAWTGPNNFTSSVQNPTVQEDGTYTLVATGANGCTASTTALVDEDVSVPSLTATAPNILTCSVQNVDIQTTVGANSSPVQTIAWTGPNNFTSSVEDPTVSAPGVYNLVVTTQNGCTTQTSATVDQNITAPNISAAGGTLTCTVTTISLNGGSTTGSSTFAWTGPNNFSSTLEDPSVTESGDYTLTVTGPNGCTASMTANVASDVILPDVNAVSTNNLDCDELTTNLQGSSATQGVSYTWSGPNSFTSGQQNTTASIPGDYVLTVTAQNGCTSVDSVAVSQDITAPDISVNGNTIDCNNPAVQITSNSTAGVSFAWTGPNNFNSAQQNPTVQLSGAYIVTTTAANGCTSSASATVLEDKAVPGLVAVSPNTLTCAALAVDIQTTIGNNPSPVQTIAWTGPNGFSSSVEDPSVSAPGVYNLVVTTQNGCTTQTQVTVIQNITAPNISAAGGTLSCKVTSINLNGGSTTGSSTFSWAGPNNFNSNQEDPSVNTAGDYILTVTGPNGCTSSMTAVVGLDVVLPGADALSTNNLDCDDLSTTLQGNSASTGASYAWTGPSGFTSNQKNAPASAPGTYLLTVTGQNGCTSVDSVAVSQNIVAPNISATGDTIDCISGQANLIGNSTTNGVTWAWSGPNNYNSNLQNPVVTLDGNYVLTVTGLNGCTSTTLVTVVQNTQSPQVSLNGGGTLTCALTEVTLTGTIQTAGATGIWSGPNNFNSNQPTITVSTPGLYTYTVTALNNCISAPTSTILQNIQSPLQPSAAGGLLNCTFPSITLNSNSGTTGVTYEWSGPGNFNSTQQNPAVTNPGTYTVVFTDPANGCTSSATALVTQDPTVPDVAVSADSLTCKTTSVVLQTVSQTPNVTFAWTGPNGFTSTLEDPAVAVPGPYTLIATAQSGCTATFNYTVTQNTVTPNISALGDTITCAVASGQILGSSTSTNAVFAWSGPAGFTSSQSSPVVTLTGTYTLTVSTPNGCTAVQTVEVKPDVNAPVINATGATLTCLVANVTLNATSNINVSWNWSGPSGFTSTLQNPTVNAPGNYIVVATAANGCSTSFGLQVPDDTQGPQIDIPTPDELNCTTTQVGLQVSVQGAGTYGYVWSTTNGSIASGGNSASPTVTQAGNYAVTVTNASNGCTSTDNTVVIVDTDTPSAAAIEKKDVSCNGDTNGAAAIGEITGGTPPYLYSIDKKPFSPSGFFTALAPGTHTIIIQDANGCEYETSVFIDEPLKLSVDLGPDTTIHLGDFIELSLAGIVSPAGANIVQNITQPADLIVDSVFLPIYSFNYRVTVVDEGGCRASDDRTVIVDKKRLVYIPNIIDPKSAENNEFGISTGNDVERIKSFLIFDRWGEAVHEYYNFDPKDINHYWDGTIRGKEAVPAVFVYYAEILFKDGETVIYKGDITLLR